MRLVSDYLSAAAGLVAEERWAEAIALYRDAIGEHPDCAALYRALGAALERVGDGAEEIVCYQRAIELEPEQPVWVYMTLAYLLKQQRDFVGAIGVYERVLGRGGAGELEEGERRRLGFEVGRHLGECWAALGEFDAAIGAYGRALALEPERLWVWHRMGALRFCWGLRLLEAGQVAGAIAQFEQVDQVQDGAGTLIPWFEAAGGRWPWVRPEWMLEFEAERPEGQDWPRITVVTPSLNQGEYLEETILSVLNQQYPHLEYVIVDGGSTDGTAEILQRYGDRLAAVIVEPDGGQSEAINKGMARATGELLLWLNSDDLLAPGALHWAALTYLRQGSEVIAGICLVHEQGRVIAMRRPRVRQADFTVAHLADVARLWSTGHFFFQPEVVFSRSLWERVGGRLDESLHYAMDHDLWMRFAAAGARLTVVGFPFAMFRQHELQKTANRRASMGELLLVTERYHHVAVPPGRLAEIGRRLERFLGLSQPRLLVVSGLAQRFHPDYRDFCWPVGRQRWRVRVCEDWAMVDLDQFDAVLLLVDGDETTLFKRINVASYTGLRLAWYWCNQQANAFNIDIAEQVDICIPTQRLIKKVLKNTESVVLDPVLPGLVEWTAEAVAAVWRQGQFEEPIDRLFVDFLQKSGVVQRDGELEKLLSIFHDYGICYLQDDFGDSVDLSETRSLQRFKSKVAYCGSTGPDMDHPGVLCNVFEALLWGQIPIVSGDWSEWDEVLSPDVQAQLLGAECVRDPVDIKAAFDAALVRFDAEGLEGRSRRYHSGLAQLWPARLEQLGDRLRDWLESLEAAKGAQGMMAEVKRPVWDYLDAGKALADAAKWTEAIALYQEAIGQHPERAELYRALGVAQEKVGDGYGQRLSYQKAIELEPQQPKWVYGTLGHLLTEQQQWLQAIEVYRLGLERYPEQASFYRYLGLAQEHLGEVAAEMASYRRAIELERQPVWVYETLLELLVRQGDAPGAIAVGQLGLVQYPEQVALQQRVAELQREGQASQNGSAVSEERPEPQVLGSLEAYVERAKQLTEQERFQEAIGVYQEAIEQYPEQAFLYRELGVVQEKVGDFEGEVESYRKAVAIEEQPFWVYSTLASIFLKKRQNLEESTVLLTKSLELNPKNSSAYYLLGQAYDELGSFEQSIDLYKKALEIDPSLSDIYERLGDCFAKQAKHYSNLAIDSFTQATAKHSDRIEIYQKLLEVDPNNTQAYLSIGRIFSQKQLFGKALVCFQTVLQIDPGSAEAYDSIGDMMGEQGDWKEAEECYRQAVILEPSHWKYLYRLGLAVAKQGIFDVAAEHLRQAITMQGATGEVVACLGNILFDQGKWSEAAVAYHQAIEVGLSQGEVYKRLGDLLSKQGKTEEASVMYRHAIELDLN